LTTNLLLDGVCHQDSRDTPLMIGHKTLSGSAPPAIGTVGRCPSAPIRRFEVEARQASSNVRISFDARFTQDTLSRRLHLFIFQRASESPSTADESRQVPGS
jgi:hypothetical protein